MRKRNLILLFCGIMVAFGVAVAAGESSEVPEETAVSVMLKYKAQEKALAKAEKLLKKRRTADAEAILGQCLEAVPEHYEAHHLLALLSGERGDYAAAIGHMERAEAEMGRLGVLCRAWQEEHAREETADRELVSGAAQETMVTSPCAANSTRVDIGKLDRERGIAKGAGLAPLDPRRFEVPASWHFAHGNFLYKSRRWAEAAARYRQAVESDPLLAPAWNNLLGALLLAGRGGEARAMLERAAQAKVELNPELRRAVEASAPR
jgi:Tfp pilus assembly protein PilF